MSKYLPKSLIQLRKTNCSQSEYFESSSCWSLFMQFANSPQSMLSLQGCTFCALPVHFGISVGRLKNADPERFKTWGNARG